MKKSKTVIKYTAYAYLAVKCARAVGTSTLDAVYYFRKRKYKK